MAQKEKKLKTQQKRRKKYVEEGRCVACGRHNLLQKNRKICPKCYTNQKKSQYRRREKLISQGLCINCGKEPAKSTSTFCRKCTKKRVQKMMIKAWKGRIILLRAMGGRCVDCGETDLRVLEIDHIIPYHHRKNNFAWAAISRKARLSPKIRAKILKQQENKKLQLLCRNCNKIKHLIDSGSQLKFQQALSELG